MNDLFGRKPKGHFKSSVKMRNIGGTKWEYPIPKSKEYWENFCDEAERRLLKVRDPFPTVSHRFQNCSNISNSRIRSGDLSSSNNSVNFSTDTRIPSESSVYRSSNMKLKSPPNQANNCKTKQFPKSILKILPRVSPKTVNRVSSVDANTKLTRNPKLNFVSTRPSFCKTVISDTNSSDGSLSVQNELLKNSGTPHKDVLSNTKLLDHKLEENQEAVDFENALHVADETANGQKTRKSLKYGRSLKYLVRCAYKALKFLTANKKLDFEPGLTDKYLHESLPLSGKEIDVNHDEKLESETRKIPSSPDESPNYRDIQTDSKNTEYQEITSHTIPSSSRSTSGLSPEFVYPEPWVGPSSNILASIPKLSGFPRQNCDRCLSCMLKPFEAPRKQTISLPRTVLQKCLIPSGEYGPSSDDTFSDSDTSSILPNFENELQEISDLLSGMNDGRFRAGFKTSGSQSLQVIPSVQIEREKTVKRKDAVDSDEAYKNVSKNKFVQRTNESSTSQRDVDGGRTGSVATLKRSKISFSVDARSSDDEDDSLAVSIGDDPSKTKYLAPCHAPTVLRPSLEPLRALRHRKPTTLQDRIAFNESASMKKIVSSDEDDDDDDEKDSRDRLKSKSEIDTREIRKIREPADTVKKSTKTTEIVEPSHGRTLTKAKSVAVELILGRTSENVESFRKNEPRELRKGSSFSGLTEVETVDPGEGDFQAEPKDTSRKLDLCGDNECLEKLARTDCTKTGAELPLTSVQEIREVLERLGENTSASDMLETLYKEFSERILNDETNTDSNARKINKMIVKFAKLLMESKRYLHPDKFPSDLPFSKNQPFTCKPHQLKRIIPPKSYDFIVPLLGLPKRQHQRAESIEGIDMKRQRITKVKISDAESVSTDLVVHLPSLEDTTSKRYRRAMGQGRYNPYGLFLRKPRRKVITWRELTARDLEGYDPDRTLQMRTDNIMTRICQDFCQWIETLGGTDKVIDVEMLKDMFEIDFNAEACRAMQISIQEMSMVPKDVALIRNTPGASKLEMTRKHLALDARAERRPAKLKAFGRMLPWELQFVPPDNQVRKRWLRCENVPQDLETMEVVWKDITHLESVRGFVEWLEDHPEVPRPEALKRIPSIDVDALRLQEDDEMFAHLELELNQIQSLRVTDDNPDVIA